MKRYAYLILLFYLLANMAFGNDAWNSNNVPDRFKKAMQASRKRLVTVFFNGESIGEIKISYHDGLVKLLDAQEFVDSLPNIKQEYKPQILSSIENKELSANYNLLCEHHRLAAKNYKNICKYIEAKEAYIIFNPATDQLFLFINAKFIKPTPPQLYIEQSNVDFSVINAISGNYSAALPQEPTSFNLFGIHSISKENYNFQARSNYFTPFGEDATFQIDNVQLAQRTHGKLIQYGMIRNIGGNQLFSSQNLLGVSIASDYNLNEGGVASITPVEFFLSEPATVRIYAQPQGNQIFSQQYFVAGNYTVDTQDFPIGSYNIVIETETASKQITRNTMFFIKSELFPDISTPNFNISAGFNQDNQSGQQLFQPYNTQQPVIIGNYYHGLPPNLSLGLSVLSIQDQFALSISQYILLDALIIQLSEGISSNLDRGISSIFNFNADSLSLTTVMSYLDSGPNPPDPDIPPLLSISEGFSLTNSINWATNYHGLSVNLTNNYSFQQNQNSLGIQAGLPIYSSSNILSFLSLNGTFTNHDRLISLGITFTENSDVVGLSATANQNLTKDTNSKNLSVNATKRFSHDDSFSTARLGTFINSGEKPTNVGGYNYTGQFGDLGITSSQQSDQYQTNMNFRTSFGYAGGHVGVGQNVNNGILVVVESDEDIDYSVRSDTGGYLGDGNSSLNKIYPARAYQEQRVDIISNDLSSDESHRSDSFMLYPGNLQLIKFTYTKKVILITQIMEDGQPVSGDLFDQKGVYLQTIAGGSVNAAIPVKSTQLYVIKKDKNRCNINLPKITDEKEYVWFSGLNCHAVDITENKEE